MEGGACLSYSFLSCFENHIFCSSNSFKSAGSTRWWAPASTTALGQRIFFLNNGLMISFYFTFPWNVSWTCWFVKSSYEVCTCPLFFLWPLYFSLLCHKFAKGLFFFNNFDFFSYYGGFARYIFPFCVLDFLNWCKIRVNIFHLASQIFSENKYWISWYILFSYIKELYWDIICHVSLFKPTLRKINVM